MSKTTKLPGNIVEISMGDYLVYALCTHDLKTKGQVLLLYSSKYQAPANDPASAISGDKKRMYIRFPLRYALSDPSVRIVGSRPLRDDEKNLPTFRSVGLARHGEKPKGWWIIDGEDEVWVDRLEREMAYYSDDGVYNLESLKNIYDNDLYPYSAELLRKGPLGFDPDARVI